MRNSIKLLYLLPAMCLSVLAGTADSPANDGLRLMLSEVKVGVMQSQQDCALVFANRRFHFERANRSHGNDLSRKVYEGQLPEPDWNRLTEILDSPEFKNLNVPQTVQPLVMQDTHAYTISVARGQNFQNMEFLDDKSRKPYDSQLKPLLQWWKSFRGGHMTESNAPPDSHCALDTTHQVYSQ